MEGDKSVVADIILALLPSLCVSIIMAIYNYLQAKRYKDAQARESLRAEGESLQVSLLVSTAKLSYAVAMAVKRGAANGEVEDGIAQYQEAMREFKKFERKLVADTNRISD